jgi:hypothetical protein
MQIQREADLNDSRDVLCKYWNFCLTETAVSVVTEQRQTDRQGGRRRKSELEKMKYVGNESRHFN